MREIVLGIMSVLAIVCFFKGGMCISDKKPMGILYLAALVFTCGISIVCNFTLIKQNDALEKKTNGKCPEYEEVHNVYKLKK
jgi:hypothetical protein